MRSSWVGLRASDFTLFVLVDDDEKLLQVGRPDPASGLPPLRERQQNYRIVAQSKYARAADELAMNSSDGTSPAGAA